MGKSSEPVAWGKKFNIGSGAKNQNQKWSGEKRWVGSDPGIGSGPGIRNGMQHLEQRCNNRNGTQYLK